MASTPTTSNPLTRATTSIPFDQVRPEHVVPAVDGLLADGEKAIDAIAAQTGSLDYDGTLGALERSTEPLEFAMGIVEHLESVATTSELRDAYNAVLPKVSAFWSSIALHEGLYAVLKRYAETDDAKALEGAKKRLLEKTLADFRRNGAELPAEGKARLKELDQELSQVTTRYSQNVLDGTNAFERMVTDPEELSGLPESALAAARDSAKAKGKEGYRFTLQAPSVMAVLTYADNQKLREEVWRAFNRRGAGEKYDNFPLVGRILELRREKATLLGFKSFADLVTDDRMAKNGAEAARFVAELTQKTREAFERENRELLAFRRKVEGETAPELEPWDVGYYAEKQRKALYDFDEEQLRDYFPAERVLEGAFELAKTLFGVRIEPAQLPVWDDSVRAHRLLDQSGTELGVFYTDLYPRENKRDGAWMHGLIASVPPTPHVALFCANAQPPAGGKPSLMSHRDVETVFHEFGHLLHHCLSQVPVRSLACTRVAQDFVELPSQIMENWCSEKDALDRFAHHYEGGDSIPAALVERMTRARNFRAANAQMRQLGFAAVDLALHVDYSPEKHGDVGAYANRILQDYAVSKLPADYALIASFSHLFAHPVGYAAGYYSYKWAEVLDADCFTRFKNEGLFNPKTGRAFRDSILAQGDSADPLELFRAFMGRDPRLEPMLERQGLS
jgi:oligopeptidase A